MGFMNDFANKAKSGVSVVTLEAKKRARIGELNSALRALQQSLDQTYHEIGRIAYLNYSEPQRTQEVPYDQAARLLEEIRSKNEEIRQETEKFDREINLLKGDGNRGVFCPQCGAPNEMGSKFCFQCGSELIQPQQPQPETKFCPQCGARLEKDAKACSGCGAQQP